MPWITQRVADRLLDRHRRVERGVGVLEDHLQVGAELAQLAAVRGSATSTSPRRGRGSGSRRRSRGPGRAGPGPAWSCRCRTRRPARAPRRGCSVRLTPSTALTVPVSRPNSRDERAAAAAGSAPRGRRCRSSRRARAGVRQPGSGFVGNGRSPPAAAAAARPVGRAATSPCARSAAQHWAPAPGRQRSVEPAHGVAQTCIASGQRGWKRQPGGGSTRSGGAPGM